MEIDFDSQSNYSISEVPWSYVIRKDNNSGKMFNFINRIMAIAYYVLFDYVPPKISSELKTTL